ncbi:MAG: TolC family protein, partial [Myxococcota bacterium]|nr:TolC family protein [Myxococcota bacterium]
NVSAADKAFTEAQNRYNEGLTPLITLITTQQNYLQAQLNHIQSQRDVFTGRLQTYRVLGGARMEDSK